MNNLPRDATTESRRRLALAEELVRACPPAFGSEAALTGSAAAGAADGHSDLEINFWAEMLPPVEERAAWLHALGATNIAVDLEPSADGTLWTTWRHAGIWVEAGWQTIAALEDTLDALRGGGVTDHDRLSVAGAVLDAVPLRTAGRLASWQRALERYPDGLAEALITVTVRRWHWPHWVDAHWALIERQERLALAALLVDDVRGALRVLFAVNRRWERGWKWLRPARRTLAVKPAHLVERIDAIFAAAEPTMAVRACLELVLEVLALAPPREDVARAQTTIREALSLHGP